MRMILYSLIFITLWLFTNSYPQEILYAGHEIFIYTEGSNPGHNTVKFWLDAVGTVWDQDYNHSQQSLQNIITTLDFAHAYNYFNTVEDDIPIPYSNQTSAWGITHVLSSPSGYYPDGLYYGYGFYIANFGWNYIDPPLISFYLDLRDCDFTDFYDISNDIWIKYNATDNSVKIDWNDNNFTNDVTQIESNEYYAIWNFKDKTLRNNTAYTYYMDEYWSNCLALIPSPDNHPRLVWGPIAESVDIAGYNIYRKVGSGSYSLIHTNTDTEFDYTDTEFTMLRQGYVALSYYVIKLKV